MFLDLFLTYYCPSLKMEDIPSHPLGPLPWTLSTSDELLRKTNKAALATAGRMYIAIAKEQCMVQSKNALELSVWLPQYITAIKCQVSVM